MKNKLDLSVIILTYNEEIHIARCLESVKHLTDNLFIVDSYSNDKTLEIAKGQGAKVYQNKWENNYAKQFNWALDNLPITTKWVLRLDADEYLTPELKDEFVQKLPLLEPDITGIELPLKRVFMNRWIKKGTGVITMMRVFQYRKARCEQRWMDEHVKLMEGRYVTFEHQFADHNLNNIGWWSTKHNGYSIREAIDLLDIEIGIFNSDNLPDNKNGKLGNQALKKRNKKCRYASMPLFFRAFLYFIYRYIFRLGFTEGKEGFLWHFLQCWWYRTLVDVKIYEIKKNCGSDKEKIITYLKDNYGIDCRNV